MRFKDLYIRDLYIRDLHIADEELLLYGDGGLIPKRKDAVSRHLEDCWECRARLLKMQNAIAEFVDLHHQRFGAQLPGADAARALLRARLDDTGAMHAPDGGAGRMASRWTTLWTPATVLLLLGFIAVSLYAVFQVGGVHSAGDLAEALPRAGLTPGETLAVDRTAICVANFPTERTIGVPVDLRRSVFERYGMAGAKPEDYEVDYLITPDLGGATTVKNLWPEPYYRTRWNSYVKDQLETRLRTLVCSGSVDLATAQREMATDWIAAYKKYFRTRTPLREAPPMLTLLATLLADR